MIIDLACSRGRSLFRYVTGLAKEYSFLSLLRVKCIRTRGEEQEQKFPGKRICPRKPLKPDFMLTTYTACFYFNALVEISELSNFTHRKYRLKDIQGCFHTRHCFLICSTWNPTGSAACHWDFLT